MILELLDSSEGKTCDGQPDLESKKGEIGVTLYDEQELTIATREHIEVR